MGVLGFMHVLAEVVGYDREQRFGMSFDIVECGVEWGWGCGFVDQRWLIRWCFRYGMGWKGVLCAVEYLITRLACVNVTFTCEWSILS